MQDTSTTRSTVFSRLKLITSKTPLTFYGRGVCASDRTPTTSGSPAGPQSNQNVWVSPSISRNEGGSDLNKCLENRLEMFCCFQRIFSLAKGNNFRWLNPVKETKIVFFVQDNSGDKFLTAHAAGRKFSEVICRACAVVIHSWFSHLHGKFCLLALRTSRPPGPIRASDLVGRYGRFAEACFDFWFYLVACAGFSHQLVGHAGCKCRELSLDR